MNYLTKSFYRKIWRGLFTAYTNVVTGIFFPEQKADWLGEPYFLAISRNLLYHSTLNCLSIIGLEFHRDWSIQSKTTDINPKHQENVEF